MSIFSSLKRMYKNIDFIFNWRKRLCINCDYLDSISNLSPYYSCKIGNNFKRLEYSSKNLGRFPVDLPPDFSIKLEFDWVGDPTEEQKENAIYNLKKHMEDTYGDCWLCEIRKVFENK